MQSTPPPDVDGDLRAVAACVERRRHDRHPVHWGAVCRADEGEEWTVKIVDVSHGGFGLDRRLPVSDDREFWMVLDSIGTFRCRIAWTSEESCGVELVDGPRSIPATDIERLGELLLAAGNGRRAIR